MKSTWSVAGYPRRRGSGQATKRRESALLAGAIRGTTCLEARERLSPPQYKPKGAKQMPNELVKQISYILYKADEEDVKVNALLKDESIWLTQKAMAELFDCSPDNIGLHLKNVFEAGELEKNRTTEEISVVQKEGSRSVKRNMTFYNLDAIISVGYRVNSAKATKFRIWATNVLKEYIKKGFVLDDERLKQGENVFGKDYFSELLERVRSIRASERRIWQQITDIFAECSIDYDKNSEITKQFYATVQNKFHFAITGQTAAEIVYDKADHKKEHMGLTTWKNSPDGRILKSDVNIAKNYLSEKQIRQLERAVSGYFDYIEDLIEREIPFNMEQFAASINEFLEFRKYDILEGNGRIFRNDADNKAFAEYEIFNRTQKIDSDFDKMIRKVEKK
ncbi:virulence RhuM family protein [Treponema sp.]|uniref:virulence RhuM family protein n=1 Tax=Treponema sp. TaxID=166 RepID=UPI0025DCE2BF|nr:virulence RhuM family protein [Treponema sp.]